MNILFFLGRVSYGGGEKVRNWLASQLSLSGHCVYYATPKIDKQYEADMRKIGLDSLIRTIEYPYHLKKRRPVIYYRKIKQLYRDNQIDLLVYFGGSLFEQVAARSVGVKILLSERFYNGFRSFPSRVLKQIQYRVADGYVFQTPEASRIYGRRAQRLCEVIPNPIIDDLPAPQFDNLRKEVVNVGRLCRQKDQSTLIHAFSLFHQAHPDYRLIIYGSGDYLEMLSKLINDLELNNCAEIISGKTNITERIKGAELFVLSSIAEGMPNALIEAMSVGVMSISTDCPVYGSRMLVRDGINALLTPVGDAKTMAEKMSFAVDNPVQADNMRREAIKIRDVLEKGNIKRRWLNYIESMFVS